MTPLTWDTMAIIGTVASASGFGVLWLTSQFRRIERIIYREMEQHRRVNDARHQDVLRRVQRLELKAFGFTHSGPVAESEIAADQFAGQD